MHFLSASGLLWAKKKERRNLLKELFPVAKENEKNASVLSVVIVTIFYLLFSFNINYFYMPYYIDRIGAWPFLGEEGVPLAWVQGILSGEVYGKDFNSPYGPMLIYPLAWAMKLFGTTVVVARSYTYFLNLIAYGIVIFFFYKTLRHTFVLSSVIYFVAFFPFVQLSPLLSHLRVYLGILPILLAYIYFGNGKRFLLPIIGIVIGQSLLFSHEVGLCSILSIIFFFLFSYFIRYDLRTILREGVLILAGCIVSVAPMMLYLLFKGGLLPFLTSLYEYPKFISLGYSSLPFPDFEGFMADPLSVRSLSCYLPIFVYAFTAIYSITLISLGSVNRNLLLKMSLLIFGILLFRYALSRSDAGHVLRSLPPAFLLMFLFFDGAVGGIAKHAPGYKRMGNLILSASLAILILLFLKDSGLKTSFELTRFMPSNINKIWSPDESGLKIPEIKRGGIFFDDRTASSIIKIRNFLDANTKSGDYVYFFPNEPVYYFLFDRKNPTRYAMSYLAATQEQRKEIVADLEKKKPGYLIYSPNTWRIDDISEAIQVPEVVGYLNERYKTVHDMGDVLIAKRVE